MPLSVRLATLNLENLGGWPREAPALAERIRALQPVLVGLRADVLRLQKVNAEDSGRRGPRRFAALQGEVLSGAPARPITGSHHAAVAAEFFISNGRP